MNHFEEALQLLASGQLDEARIYLEELLRQTPIIPIFSTTWAFATWTSAGSIRG